MGRYVCGPGRSFALAVKADVADGKVLREGAVLHEAGEPRRTETVMEFSLGCVHSTRKEHLEHPVREPHGSPDLGQARGAVGVETPPSSRAVEADDALDEFGGVLEGQVHALAPRWSHDMGCVPGQEERPHLHGLGY